MVNLSKYIVEGHTGGANGFISMDYLACMRGRGLEIIGSQRSSSAKVDKWTVYWLLLTDGMLSRLNKTV